MLTIKSIDLTDVAAELQLIGTVTITADDITFYVAKLKQYFDMNVTATSITNHFYQLTLQPKIHE